MLVIHVFAQMSPPANCISVCTKLTKEFHIANTLIPQIRLCIYNLGDFFSCCWVSWYVFINPSIKPLCSSHGSGCKGKSPSYLHLFP